jgi:hypothetical protein
MNTVQWIAVAIALIALAYSIFLATRPWDVKDVTDEPEPTLQPMLLPITLPPAPSADSRPLVTEGPAPMMA